MDMAGSRLPPCVMHPILYPCIHVQYTCSVAVVFTPWPCPCLASVRRVRLTGQWPRHRFAGTQHALKPMGPLPVERYCCCVRVWAAIASRFFHRCHKNRSATSTVGRVSLPGGAPTEAARSGRLGLPARVRLGECRGLARIAVSRGPSSHSREGVGWQPPGKGPKMRQLQAAADGRGRLLPKCGWLGNCFLVVLADRADA